MDYSLEIYLMSSKKSYKAIVFVIVIWALLFGLIPVDIAYGVAIGTGSAKVYDGAGLLTSEVISGQRYVYVGFAGMGYGTIAAAISASRAGDIVYAHSGTYNEHVVLSSGVSLIGEEGGATIIHGNYQSQANVIRALGGNRIENLTISGGGPYAGTPSSAVSIEGSNVTITNNRVVDNQNYGLYIRSGSNILIENNFLEKNGIGVQLPNSGTTILSNTFVNNNIAINVLNGPATVIRDNIITGSTFQSIYEFSWSAYSSGQPASGNAIVEGNVLYNNKEKGGYYTKCLPPAVINQTLGNRISDPLFINPASGDYSVPVNSPAYGKGFELVNTPIIGPVTQKPPPGVWSGTHKNRPK